MHTLSLVTCFLLCCVGGVVCRTDAEDAAEIDAFINDIMTSEEMVGLTVAVVKEGRPLLASGYGIMDINTLGDVTNETLFYLASCSKAFNAALVSHMLSLDGRYTYDTPVREIWPEFALATGFRSEHATVRDVVAHRVGIPESLLPILAGVIPTRDDYISRARFFPALYPFRSGESYHNTMVTIGGYLAGILAGSTWEEATRQTIFNPLLMDQTTFVQELTPAQYDNMATGHETDDGSPRTISMDVFGDNLGPATPSGGIVTNSVDMQKWLMFLTSKGLAEDGSRVMNESDIMRTMLETSVPYYVTVPDDANQPIDHGYNGIALGWYSETYRGYNLAAHGGYFFGFQSKVSVLHDKGMAVYTGINCADGYNNGSVQERVHNFALDTVLGLQPSESQAYPAPVMGGALQTSMFVADDNVRQELALLDGSSNGRALDDYAGTYGNFLMGNITVMYNSTSDELWGTWGTLGVVHILPGLQNDSFIGIVQEPLWFAPPLSMTFESTDGIIFDRLTIPFFLPPAPPVFIRDLEMDDAPPPSSDSCEDIPN